MCILCEIVLVLCLSSFIFMRSARRIFKMYAFFPMLKHLEKIIANQEEQHKNQFWDIPYEIDETFILKMGNSIKWNSWETETCTDNKYSSKCIRYACMLMEISFYLLEMFYMYILRIYVFYNLFFVWHKRIYFLSFNLFCCCFKNLFHFSFKPFEFHYEIVCMFFSFFLYGCR